MGSYTTGAIVCAVSLGLLLIISYKNVLSVSSTMQLQYLGWVWNQFGDSLTRNIIRLFLHLVRLLLLIAQV